MIKERKSEYKIKSEIIQTKAILNFFICDDDKIIANSIAKSLKKIKYQELGIIGLNSSYFVEVNTTVCINGIDCIYEIYKDYKVGKKYSYLFIDEQMPGIYGSTTIKILKDMIAAKNLNNIKIYSITGYDDEEFEKTLKKFGCDGILTKPVSQASLESLFKDNKFDEL